MYRVYYKVLYRLLYVWLFSYFYSTTHLMHNKRFVLFCLKLILLNQLSNIQYIFLMNNMSNFQYFSV